MRRIIGTRPLNRGVPDRLKIFLQWGLPQIYLHNHCIPALVGRLIIVAKLCRCATRIIICTQIKIMTRSCARKRGIRPHGHAMNVDERRYPLTRCVAHRKIRCDATSEANVEQCSSCKRAGVNCSFSRVPMKRGPTKGLEAQYAILSPFRANSVRYIRELEDRLVSLEYSVQTKTHVVGRDHSPSPRRHVDYNGTSGTPPQLFKQPHPHQSEPVKLN